ncbi:hypothetical protein E3J62_00980 [candidate division TA06 bacterium]|uniref:DUF4249 family protein n=1 Tax=candidate division TA06 bacterium TaxID=2250710 RepID=A0A523UZ21_UNCT6|nr:MAG: hypothetical protein E3J62_00980 [candidate division TA06 bacterium]
MSVIKTSWTIVLTLTVVLVGLIVGCRGPVGPEGPAGTLPIYVLAYLESPFLWDTTSDVRVDVLNVSGIPAVYVNDIKIPYDMYRASYRFFDPDFPISAGDSARLRIEHTKADGSPGISQASIKLPGRFAITSHDTSGIDTIPFGSDLIVTWSSSDGADAYRAYGDFFCAYLDTSGAVQQHDYRLCTLFVDTSLTFLSSVLFPDTTEVDSVTIARGGFYVSGMSGPWQGGEAGNITGDGIGIFRGWTDGGQFEFTATID